MSNRRSASSSVDTASRVLGQHGGDAARELSSTTRQTFLPPEAHRLYQPRANEGPRARRQREEMLRLAQEELRREQELAQEEQSRIDYVTVTQDSFFRSDLSTTSCGSTKSIEDVDVERLVREPAITFYSYDGDSAAVTSKPFYRSRRFTSNQEEEELWN